jgi:hypothetical protein
MMRRLVLAAAAAALISSAHVRPSAAQDAEPSYPFCAIIGGNGDDVHDCSFTTRAQCQAAAMSQGYCVDNPAYVAPAVTAAPAPVAANTKPPAPRKRRAPSQPSPAH